MPIIYSKKELRPRQSDDWYPTPHELTAATLRLLPTDFVPKRILDPGAGRGEWGQMIKERFPKARLTGIELVKHRLPARIRQVYDEWIWNDYLDWANMQKFDVPSYDLIIGNPPYGQSRGIRTNLAEKFIRASWRLLTDNGQMIFLLRLAFLESQERGYGLWEELAPTTVHVCIERPSFTSNRRTDATAYALYEWKKVDGFPVNPTRLRWLSWRSHEKVSS